MMDEKKSRSPEAGAAGVKAMLMSAEEETSWLAREAAGDPEMGMPWLGVEPGSWADEADELGLFPGCPIFPLGKSDNLYFFLDTTGELRVFSYNELGKAGVSSLFQGRHKLLYWAWPRGTRGPDGTWKSVNGWDNNFAQHDLMGACARQGTFDPADKPRGRGVWRSRRGDLIVHCGDKLYLVGREESAMKEVPLGVYEGHVYMSRPPIARPWPVSMIDMDGPALEIFPLLKTWNWARPDVDPVLLIGEIGAMILGAALDFRPTTFLVGDRARGKSTLQQLIRALLQGWLIKAADATSAGIYQQLKHDALPVSIDELESEEDNRKGVAIMKLARTSASGDLILRGGDKHSGMQFFARSAFIFSAINPPPMETAEMSRMAFLVLRTLQAGQAEPVIDEDLMGRVGQRIVRKLLDNWHRFPTTLAAYKAALAKAGHDGRGQSTFGTLLACADLIIDTDATALGLEMGDNATYLDVWGTRLRPATMIEYQGQSDNWRACISHVLTSPIDAWKGGTRTTVGGVIERYWAVDYSDQRHLSLDDANEALGSVGLKLIIGPDKQIELFIPNNNTALQRLFQGSKWYGKPNSGGWALALTTGMPEEMYRHDNKYVTGNKGRGLAVSLNLLMPAER